MKIPEGFVPHSHKSPATDPWEPLFAKTQDGIVSIGLQVRVPHCNAKGILHGGILTSLCDNAMGFSAIQTLKKNGGPERTKSGVTLTLAMDFLASAAIDQWLEITPRVLKVGQSVAFVDCVVTADGALIARANASFRVYLKEADS